MSCGVCVSVGLLLVESAIVLGSWALFLAVVLRTAWSWLPVQPPPAVDAALAGLTEPVLRPIRRVLPAGELDLSPLVALIAIPLASGLLLRLLPGGSG